MMTSEQLSPVLHAVYEKYNPSKMVSIPQLLTKYRGSERDLLSSVFIKYNIPKEEQDWFLDTKNHTTPVTSGEKNVDASYNLSDNRKKQKIIFIVIIIALLTVLAFLIYDGINSR